MKQSFEIYLTRLIQYFRHLDRIGILWYIFATGIVIILMAAFRYSVIEHRYFARIAEQQQKAVIKNPSSRGNIISSAASLHGIL